MEIAELYQAFKDSSSFTTDTRKIEKGDMFFALKGENFNGNHFAKQALENGAAYVVIDEEEYMVDERTILVTDVLTSLQLLAKHHRQTLNIPVIAVTGSNGKTTTKELLNSVLSTKYAVSYTLGNLNNHIGVPLTLLAINETHEIALVEMGDNHPKEVEFLCSIALPDFGFVTNVGKDHLEGFGSMENNKLAKKEVFDYLLAHDGLAFVDVSDEVVMSLVDSDLRTVNYGRSNTFANLGFVESNPFVVIQSEGGLRATTKLFGAYNFNNMNLAYCIGKYFKIEDAIILDALAGYSPTNNRSQIVETGRNTLILDAYNANPSSVEEALKSFSEMDTDKSKIVVLGDMFELGSFSKEEHQNMADLAQLGGFDHVLLIGENYALVEGVFSAQVFSNKEEASLAIKKIAPEGAIILFKGSRGMRLETLVDFF